MMRARADSLLLCAGVAISAGFAAHAITDFGLWNQLVEHGKETREAVVFIARGENGLLVLDIERKIFGDGEGEGFVTFAIKFFWLTAKEKNVAAGVDFEQAFRNRRAVGVRFVFEHADVG